MGVPVVRSFYPGRFSFFASSGTVPFRVSLAVAAFAAALALGSPNAQAQNTEIQNTEIQNTEIQDTEIQNSETPAIEIPGSETRNNETYDDKGIFTAQFENDMFGGSDQHFTHGTRFSWLSPESRGWVEDMARLVPFFDSGARRRVSFSLGQNIFTPEDISEPALIPDERPYAGWLYGSVGLVSENGERLDNLELQIGVVGPASFAEEVQTNWHDFIGIDEPFGWDNQLENEPGVVLYYERKWRQLWEFPPVPWIPVEDLAVDVTPHLGGALGNVYTYGAAGATFRFGDDLPNDYGPPRIRPSLPGTDFFRPPEDDFFSWYFFVGLEGRVMARNIFLDGNTFEDSHSVSKKLLVGDLQGGLAVTLGPVRVAYTHILRSKEFDGQGKPDQFGSLSLSTRF